MQERGGIIQQAGSWVGHDFIKSHVQIYITVKMCVKKQFKERERREEEGIKKSMKSTVNMTGLFKLAWCEKLMVARSCIKVDIYYTY